jgi:hypothetical protein
MLEMFLAGLLSLGGSTHAVRGLEVVTLELSRTPDVTDAPSAKRATASLASNEERALFQRLVGGSMNKSERAAVLFAIAALCSEGAGAARQTFTAQIDSITMIDDGSLGASVGNTQLVYIWPVGGMPNQPACATNGPYVSFSLSRPMGKAYLAAMLEAQAAGKKVEFRTNGACLDQANSDTLYYFRVIS